MCPIFARSFPFNQSTGGMAEQAAAVPWWQRGVIYQIYPRSFNDTDGDGVGDLDGVVERMEYLSETLGVDALWLSPFYPSPMADFGYDVADYCDVDPLFGDLAAFDRLVDAAHAGGLKLIVDFVPNHSSDQHPWFQASRRSRTNPRRDWYVWRDPKPDGSPPNNWLSVFGGPAWTFDEATGQYYLHSFLKEQPDLNWRNPAVKEAMFDVLRFWMDRGVDGFRIDVAHAIMKDPALRDNPPNPDAGGLHKSHGAYDTQLHLYDKGHEDVHQIFGEIRCLVDTYGDARPRVAIGEIHVFDLDEWVTYYGVSGEGLHMPFNFGLLAAPWSADGIRKAVDALEAALPEAAWPNYVLGNHDETRLATRYGAAGSRLAAMLLLTLRGTPTLYYGDEIGLREAAIPPEQQQDPWGKNVPGLDLGRDGCRTPMQWDASPQAGFTTSNAPWLPVQDDFIERNVQVQRDRPTSILNLYRRLLALRRATPALQVGAYAPVEHDAENMFVFTRTHAGQRLLVGLNFADDARRAAVPPGGRLLLSTHLDRSHERVGPNLVLRAHEGVIVQVT